MNSRLFKTAIFICASLFCLTSYAQWNPTGTSTTDAKFRSGLVGIGLTSAPSGVQLSVKSGAAGTVPLIVNTPTSPTVDVAQFQVNGSSKFVINKTGNVSANNGLNVSGAAFNATNGATISGAALTASSGLNVTGNLNVTNGVLNVSSSVTNGVFPITAYGAATSNTNNVTLSSHCIC